MSNKRLTKNLALIASLLAMGGAEGANRGVIANAQVTETEPGRYRVHIQSSAPLAFDLRRTKNAGLNHVRLYNSRLGKLPAFGRWPFGSLNFRSFLKEGDAQLTLVTTPGYQVRAVQGTDPNVVEVEIAR